MFRDLPSTGCQHKRLIHPNPYLTKQILHKKINRVFFANDRLALNMAMGPHRPS
jgi:hypothetical protein